MFKLLNMPFDKRRSALRFPWNPFFLPFLVSVYSTEQIKLDRLASTRKILSLFYSKRFFLECMYTNVHSIYTDIKINMNMHYLTNGRILVK